MLIRTLDIIIQLMGTKKGFILSFADLIKGLILGFIIGLFVSYLATNGIINLPLLSP